MGNISMTSQSIPLPRQEALVEQLKVLSESLSEFREALRPVNDEVLNNAFREFLDIAEKIVERHARRPGERVADDLANLRSLLKRRNIAREDMDLGRTPTLKALRSSRGSVLADFESALEEAHRLGLVPTDPTSNLPVISVGVEIQRAGREGQLRALEERLRRVEQTLQTNIAPEGRHDAGNSLQQVGLVNFYVESMKTELSLAKLEARANISIDLTSLARAIEAIGELTADFVATVEGLKGKVTDGLKSAALVIRLPVNRVVSGFKAVVFSVRRRARRPRDGFAPGDRFRDFQGAPEMVVVPAGEFMMGSSEGQGDPNEYPQHPVTIANRFAVGVCPITRDEFAVFVNATKRKIDPGAVVWNGKEWKHDPTKSWFDPGFEQKNDHPVVCVNWRDAQDYVAWLKGSSGGKLYRLISEAEWEYCCRAGTTSAYSTGDTITPEQANFGRAKKGTTSVFNFPPNPWGLHDMHGNVWEWCEDHWHENYRGNPPADGSVWPGGDTSLHVLRGGSWGSDSESLRSANRYGDPLDLSFDIVGFRVARTL